MKETFFVKTCVEPMDPQKFQAFAEGRENGGLIPEEWGDLVHQAEGKVVSGMRGFLEMGMDRTLGGAPRGLHHIRISEQTAPGVFAFTDPLNATFEASNNINNMFGRTIKGSAALEDGAIGGRGDSGSLDQIRV